MLSVAIALPLLTGLLVILLPGRRPGLVRWVAVAGALGTLGLVLALWAGYDPALAGLQAHTTAPWIPELGASYDVAVDGLSLPLMALAALLTSLALWYAAPAADRPRTHAFLFLVMATGLLGVFAARDLLLFYMFWEVALVPLYFIIGIWGGDRRRYAAMKFFLYTRVGSLAMLLAFLGLYLAMAPHTFSMAAIAAAHPLSGAKAAGGLVLAGMLLGFGVKLPSVPLHNWLPDAHVEAPTEGSVLLAGALLKMGGYGLIALMLPLVPEAARAFGWGLAGLALASILYGALAALGQQDLKRLVAYTSIAHMGFVTLGVAVWALAEDASVRQLALNGAALQLVSHGLLTGGMFFLAGILQHQAGTRELDRLGGLWGRAPAFGAALGLLAFGSLGLPGLSGFVAEFQVLGAALSVAWWLPAVAVVGVAVSTGLYVRVVGQILLGPEGDRPGGPAMRARSLVAVAPLVALAVALGLAPGPVIAGIEAATRAIAHGGG